MMPMKINGNDPRRLLSDIFNDGKTLILNPLHSQVDNLGRDPLSLKKVGQSKESHREKVDPNELINGSVVIDKFRDMNEKAVYSFHRGNCKMSEMRISTPHPFYGKSEIRISNFEI